MLWNILYDQVMAVRLTEGRSQYGYAVIAIKVEVADQKEREHWVDEVLAEINVSITRDVLRLTIKKNQKPWEP